MIPVIDGHNDVLSRSYENSGYDFVTGAQAEHLTLDAALESGFAAGLFAVFIPPSNAEKKRSRSFADGLSTPGSVPLARAQRVATAMFSQLRHALGPRERYAAGGRETVGEAAGSFLFRVARRYEHREEPGG
ncbi:MAG: hypothetical protein R6V29_03605, partial [Spirochaetia bacterium]